MSIHPEYEDLMTEALFDEIAPEDRRRLDEHLQSCAECHAEFERLQATLSVVAERERDELPSSYWASFRRQVLARVDGSPSMAERLRQWWHALPVLFPQTGGQWALQGAIAVLCVALGLWWGQGATLSSSSTDEEPVASSADTSPWTTVLLGDAPSALEAQRIRPQFRGVRTLSFDRPTGQVHVRYRVATEKSVSGPPDDPTIQRLLQAALLDSDHPASQLHALQTLERSGVRPTDDLTQALTVLIRSEDDPGLQVRAVRTLRRMHAETALDPATRNLLIGLVLDDNPTGLRVEALQTLMTAPDSSTDSGYLYALRDDPNDYLRYQARSTLQTAALTGTPDVEHP